MKRTTRTITLRIDAPLEEMLDRDAKEKGLTINSLANQIFKRYSEWDRYAEGLCIMPISRDILRLILDGLSREESRHAGEGTGSFIPREQTSLLFGGYDHEKLVHFLELWFSRFSSYEHRINGNIHYFAVHHDVCHNFSLFLASFVEAALNDAGCSSINISPSKNTLTFSFKMTYPRLAL